MTSKVHLEFTEKKIFADNIDFERTGPYERLIGKAIYEIDPDDSQAQQIVDIDKAQINSKGLIEFYGDIDILKPVDVDRGNHRLLYDVNNRGSKTVLRNFNDAPASSDPLTVDHSGNGFLMRRGYTIVWSGWQGDILPSKDHLSIELPEAYMNGQRIQGQIRSEFIVDQEGVICLPLSGNTNVRSYEAVNLDTGQATLTRRKNESDPRLPVPSTDWQFARASVNPQTGILSAVPSKTDIYIPDGFSPGWIYELIYQAEGSRVMGLGMEAIRSLVSTLRYESHDASGTTNPLSGYIDNAYGFGSSLCARVLRQFVYDGFNLDEKERKVFDGIYPHVSGGGRLFMNTRFAQVGRFPRQHEEHQWPSERYPFAYSETVDPFQKSKDSVLKRPDSDPLVIHTHTATEYWQRHASTGHIDPVALTDLTIPENVRMYFLASAQHGGASGTGTISQEIPNTNATSPFMRACLTALDAWVSQGIAPPANNLPKREDHSLVTPKDALTGFPSIPGTQTPTNASQLPLYDYGEDFNKGIISNHPPKDTGKQYTLYVPNVDEDGNDTAGLRSPDIQAPIGTHTGWSLRKQGFSENELANLTGSFIPFPRTKSERIAQNDPRLSIEERYKDFSGYIKAFTAAVDQLLQDGYILQEDANRYIEAAKKRDPTHPNTVLLPLKLPI
ncbi:alpha/beta hydrolase domain-containing protein [Dehalococcoidia bacterium]|nr:alpha/beta hydrolase domain-containing protein [Dehalococcoidia bacterium]